MEKKKIFVSAALIVVVAVIIFYIFNKEKAEDISIDREFDHIEVESDNAEIQLMPIKGDKAFVELENNEKNRYRLDVKVKRSTLEIELERKGFGWLSFDFTSKAPKVTIGLPSKEYGVINAETDNGLITITEIKADKFMVDTDNGEVLVKNAKSQSLSARTDNGHIMLEDNAGEIEARSDNGTITILNETIEEPMELRTDNGEILVKTKDHAKNVKYKIKTDNGKVNLFGQSTAQEEIGEGDIVIELTSDNGSITVD